MLTEELADDKIQPITAKGRTQADPLASLPAAPKKDAAKPVVSQEEDELAALEAELA